MTDFDSLPPPLQRAITARDGAMAPFRPAIESLDVSWTIVEGNLRELHGTLDLFDTDDHRKAIALWQQPHPVSVSTTSTSSDGFTIWTRDTIEAAEEGRGAFP